MDLIQKQRKEIDFWRTSPLEGPEKFTIENIVEKMALAKTFLNKINEYKEIFSNKKTVLEIGGGQGWASCLLKKYYLAKDSIVINSDISKYALQSTHYWQYHLDANIDKIACRSYEIPLKSNYLDVVFAFQAAHHLYKHSSTLKEIFRVLKPGGVCLYITEPSCRKYIYPLAFKRVNLKRPDVAEDVLIFKEIIGLAKKAGFIAAAYYDTSFINKRPFETIYYYLLSKIKIFKYFLPCAMDYVFTKPTMT